VRVGVDVNCGVRKSGLIEGVREDLSTVPVNCRVADLIVGETSDGRVALKGGDNLSNISPRARNTKAAKIIKPAQEKNASLK
jgi:hypothetical protein